MADRVKDVATEEAERLKGLAKEAVQSRAYIYPIKVALHGCAKSLPRTDRGIGHLLFRQSQGIMASLGLKAHAHVDARCRCYYLHVRGCISTSGGTHGFHIRSDSSCVCGFTHLE